MELCIDIETYCELDIKDVGLYRYVEHESFEVLMIAYGVDDDPVKIIDLASGATDMRLYREFRKLFFDPKVDKSSYNAAFEIESLAKHFGRRPERTEWMCTMIHALYAGLPMGLDRVAKALKLVEEKDPKGKALIRYFSKPCKKTKKNGGRTRNLPHHDPEKWQEFLDYCVKDVVVERAIKRHVSVIPFPEKEKKLWILDQEINRRGVRIDRELVEGAVEISHEWTGKLLEEVGYITGCKNPNSVAQLKKWLLEEHWMDVKSLNKETVFGLLEAGNLHPDVHRVLEIRLSVGKSSVKKYEAMLKSVCDDGKIRGLLQHYGASRTGRWAGRLVQVQNLTKNYIDTLELARQLVKDRDTSMIEMVYGDPQDILSQLVRTAFIPDEGNQFIVSDFSAIEARVISWFANEKWRMEVFDTHGKIYEASASQMFHVPIEEVTKGSPYRARGKVSELALGYQGGPNALIQMGALDMGIEESELKPMVQRWRKANSNIVKFWYAVQKKAIQALKTGRPTTMQYGLKFVPKHGNLFIRLPSGRYLCYHKARITEGKYGDAIKYMGTHSKTKHWTWLDTYGGKLVENIVQATARDCLAESMFALDDEGYKTELHVHDEVVLNVPKSYDDLDNVIFIMSQDIDWAPGLNLTADAFETKFYMKD